MEEVTGKKRGWKRRAVSTGLDRAIEYFAPEKALRRAQARMRLALTGGYTSGDRSRPSNKNWGRSDGSANAEILPYLDNIRSDSRDLERKSPLARGAINTVVTSAIGTGLIPQSCPDREVLKKRAGLSDEEIDVIGNAFEREFMIWGAHPGSDAAMKNNFAAQQRMALRGALVSGDIFPLRRMIARPGRRHLTAIQMIEADRVVNPQGQADKPLMHAGVERDQYGAAMAYHVLKSHPGDRWIGSGRRETQRIPAYTQDGDWQMLQLMVSERPEQTRGVPYLAPVIDALKQLSDYTEAEIKSAVISSMFTVFVETEGGQGLPNIDSDGNIVSGGNAQNEISLGSGSILDLAPGEKVSFANPGRPNQAFDPFVLAILRQVGVALEIPFEILVKHFTASYSAAQAALVEAWKFFKVVRSWVACGFCQPCYEAVIVESVAREFVDAPGFFSDPILREAYLMTEWIGPPRGMIDQLKEGNAAALAEDRGWKTAQENTAEMTGGDWDRKHQRRVREENMRREAGFSVMDRTQAGTQEEQNPQDQPEQN